MPTTSTPVLDLDGERTPLRSVVNDLMRHRGLVLMLARQDFAARYRSAVLGLSWTVALPLLQGVVIAIVFKRVVRIHTSEPYAGFVLVGMAAWGYLNGSLATASTSVVDGGQLATKVYFPRLVLPAVAPTSNLVGYLLSTAVALGVATAQTRAVHWQLVLLPVTMALAYLLTVSVGALAALAHVWFRDVRYLVTAILLIAFYATPVIYPLSLAGGLRPYVLANPATGVVELSRWCVFGRADSLAVAVAGTVAWTLVLSAAAVVAYARHDRTACDQL